MQFMQNCFEAFRYNLGVTSNDIKHRKQSGFGWMSSYIRTLGIIGCTVLLAVAAVLSSATARESRLPLGNWSTANGHGVIAIVQCGDALCGRIVGIDRRPGDPMPTDVNGRSQCGLTIITNGRPEAGGSWHGEITDPRDGGIYQAKLWLDEAGNLRLRGFIGIPLLGSTQIWHPFNGKLTADCGLA